MRPRGSFAGVGPRPRARRIRWSEGARTRSGPSCPEESARRSDERGQRTHLAELHLSEHAAYGRIEAARAARRFPVILERLAEGSVTLTTVGLLASHLTPENHRDLLAMARHQSKRQVEALVARLRPPPPVPASVRRLPTAGRTSASPIALHGAAASPQPTGDTQAVASPPLPSPALAPPPARPAVVAPLAPERYRVQFTASAETHAKLRLAQALLRHQIPDGDLGKIVDRALTALLRDVAKQRLAATDRPRGSRGQAPGSRHIPAEVRRAVWLRDGGRCAFISSGAARTMATRPSGTSGGAPPRACGSRAVPPPDLPEQPPPAGAAPSLGPDRVTGSAARRPGTFRGERPNNARKRTAEAGDFGDAARDINVPSGWESTAVALARNQRTSLAKHPQDPVHGQGGHEVLDRVAAHDVPESIDPLVQ